MDGLDFSSPLRQHSGGNGQFQLTPGKQRTSSNVQVVFENGINAARATVEIQRLRNGDARCTIHVVAGNNTLSASIKMSKAAVWVRVIQRSSCLDMEVFMRPQVPLESQGVRTLALLKITDLNNDVQSDSDDDDEVEKPFDIFVKLFNGKSSVFTVRSEMLVKELKVMIHRKHQLPPDQQRLIYQGKQLEDNFSLGHYVIGPNATLNLVTRLRGG